MMLIKIKEDGVAPRNMVKAWNQVRREGYRAIAVMWHRDMRPDHFQPSAKQKYSYKPRAGEPGNPRYIRLKTGQKIRDDRKHYTARKLRMKGHTRPLVFTGQSEALSRIRDIRVTSKGSRVVLHTPGLNRRNKYSQINMREELTRITEGEARLLAKEYERATARNFKRVRDRSERTIK
jgi:hypothetical protein